MRLRSAYFLVSICSVLTAAPRLSVAQSQTPPTHPTPIPGAPAGATAFVNVGVVPMDRERVLTDQTVLVEGGRITALGPTASVSIPAGAVRIDGRGKFLLPGLSDMHAHLVPGPHIGNVGNGISGFPESAPQVDSAGTAARLFLWLANGVTTVRNLDYFNEDWGRQAQRLRARAAAGADWIPHIYTAGEWGPKQYIGFEDQPQPVLDSIAAYIAAYKAAGYDFIKVHNESPVILDSVLAAAKRVGIPVVGHVPPPARVEHVLWGYTSIEHPFTDYLWSQRQNWPSNDTAGFGALAGALHRAGVWHCPTQGHYDYRHGAPVKLLKVELDSGIKLLTGTDEVPWLGVITRELQSFVDGGLTPYQALLASTRNVAEYFGTLQERGTLTIGKRADMILLTGNPLQDVRYTAQPAGVMLGGRWLPRAEIDRRLATLTLPMHAAGEPVKSYWSNMIDEILLSMAPVLHGLHPTDTQHATYRTLSSTYQAQRKALADSLGESDQFTASTQRVLQLLAHQMGDMRTKLTLTPDQRTQFDQRAETWVHQWRAQGYPVTIPGV